MGNFSIRNNTLDINKNFDIILEYSFDWLIAEKFSVVMENTTKLSVPPENSWYISSRSFFFSRNYSATSKSENPFI